MEYGNGSGETGEVGEDEEIFEEIIEEDDNDIEETILHETVEQTIERVKKENGVEEKSLSEEDKPSRDTNENPKHNATKSKSDQQSSDESTQQEQIIPPPQRFTGVAKEQWAQTPRVVQEQYQKAIQDLEAGQQQKLREIHEVRSQAETIVKAISPWAKDWATQGISVHQGVALLAKTHERMVKNPAAEISRLIKDNGVSLEEIRAVMNGETPQSNGASNNSTDIFKHPEFLSLQNRINQYDNERHQEIAKRETDKILALREEVDSNGNKPYWAIHSREFLDYARPLVAALRTPPRGPDGKFTGPPMSLLDAYKKAYKVWISENSQPIQAPQNTSQQSVAQTQNRQAQPVAMRSRNVPIGRSLVGKSNSENLYETVEQTIARLKNQNWQS